MARPTLSTVFSAVDLLSPTLKKMGVNVEKLGYKIEETGKKSSNSFLNLKNIATGAIAYLATSKLTGMVQEFSTVGDEIAKTSSRLGLTAEELQKLRYAAGQQGATTEDLNAGFETMNTNLGKLAVGSGKMAGFLKKSNPQLLAQLKGAKNNSEAFKILINQINKTKNISERAALATAAFGGAGEKMILMAKGGTETLDELGKAAEKYGIISNDAAAESEKLNDAQDNLSKAYQGLLNASLGPLFLKLTPLIQKFADFIAQNRELIATGLDTFFSVLNTALDIFVGLWNSGLLPAIGSGIIAFKTIKSGIIAYNTVMALSKIGTLSMIKSWLALNAAFLISPIGLIVLGIAALIAVGVLLYKNWDFIKQKAGELWQAMTKIYDNSTILQYALKALGVIALIALSPILLPLAAIAGAIYGLYKAWQAVRKYLPSWLGGDTEPTPVPEVPEIGNARSPGLEVPQIGGAGTPGLVSGNQGAIQSQNINTNNRSTLDVNFNNTPPGTTTRQSGRAPGINVNTGAGGSRP